MPAAGTIVRGLLDLLAPRACPACDALTTLGESGFCAACEPLLEPRSGGVAAYVFGGPLADAIRRLKYEHRSDLAAPLGALLARAASPHVGRADVVVPVPLHPRRLRARGFNQSALIAAPVARVLGVPLDVRWLERVRDTPPQAGLEAPGRDDNVRGAFAARRPRPGARVLLVDDVRTTGATLSAAAGALRASGAREVRRLALAGVE